MIPGPGGAMVPFYPDQSRFEALRGADANIWVNTFERIRGNVRFVERGPDLQRIQRGGRGGRVLVGQPQPQPLPHPLAPGVSWGCGTRTITGSATAPSTPRPSSRGSGPNTSSPARSSCGGSSSTRPRNGAVLRPGDRRARSSTAARTAARKGGLGRPRHPRRGARHLRAVARDGLLHRLHAPDAGRAGVPLPTGAGRWPTASSSR